MAMIKKSLIQYYPTYLLKARDANMFFPVNDNKVSHPQKV